MNRQEFIQKIIELYPDTFKPDRVEHIQAWVEMYEKALPKNWNMDKLMWYFSTEYKSTVVPPAPSFFYQFRNDVKPPKKEEPIVQMTPEEQEECEKARLRAKEMLKHIGSKMSMDNVLR